MEPSVCNECDRGFIVLHKLEHGFPIYGFQCGCNAWMKNNALITEKMRKGEKPLVRGALTIYKPYYHKDFVVNPPWDWQLHAWFRASYWKHPDFVKALQFYPGRVEIMKKYKAWQEAKDEINRAKEIAAISSSREESRQLPTTPRGDVKQSSQGGEISL